RVDGEEVAGENRFAMRSEEAAPGLRIALRRRWQAGAGENVAHGARRDSDACLAQLAGDPQVAPARVLAGEAQDQLAYIGVDPRPARAAVRVCPAASEQSAMPGQQRLRPHRERGPGAARKHPAKRGQQHSVVRLEARPPDLARRVDNSWRSTRISSSLARSSRPRSTTNSSRRQTTTYKADKSKGDLQRTGTPTLPPSQ